jgi:hypothetical protein
MLKTAHAGERLPVPVARTLTMGILPFVRSMLAALKKG